MEVDKIKKESKDRVAEYEQKLLKKNKIINDLLTESENKKIEVNDIEKSLNGKNTEKIRL